MNSVKFLTILIAAQAFALSAKAQDQLPDFGSYDWQYAFHEFGGDPLYPEGYSNWEYFQPEAPRGGVTRSSFRTAWQGFNHDSQSQGLGVEAPGVRTNTYDTLWTSNGDELFTTYGFVSDKFKRAEDESWVLFHIDDRAAWWDGRPITAEDVAFTFNKMLSEGAPTWQDAKGKFIDSIVVLGSQELVFFFTEEGAAIREMPIRIAGEPLLDPQFWQDRPLNEQLLIPPQGSGPFRVTDFELGGILTYELVDTYWAANHPSQVGTLNFSRVEYDFIKDTPAQRIAFRARELDRFSETTMQEWKEGWEDLDDLVEAGVLHRLVLPSGAQVQPQMAFFNLRLEKFQDPRVRQALILAFDFETANERFFYDQYTRNNSYYQNAANLQALGPADDAEIAIMDELRDLLSDEAYEANLGTPYVYPETNGGGDNDAQLDAAFDLLLEAGFTLSQDGKLLDANGEPFTIKVDYYSIAFGRIWDHWKNSLELLGIDVVVEQSERGAWVNRLIARDFEVVSYNHTGTATPGLDIQYLWSSDFPDAPVNISGLQDPFVDALGRRAVASDDLAEIQAIGRLFDRHMRNQHYGLLFWHSGEIRQLSWDVFGRPADEGIRAPIRGAASVGWWQDQDLRATFDERYDALR